MALQVTASSSTEEEPSDEKFNEAEDNALSDIIGKIGTGDWKKILQSYNAKRAALPSLRCRSKKQLSSRWQTLHRGARGSSASADSAPSKKRGRPRKSAVAAARESDNVEVDED